MHRISHNDGFGRIQFAGQKALFTFHLDRNQFHRMLNQFVQVYFFTLQLKFALFESAPFLKHFQPANSCACFLHG